MVKTATFSQINQNIENVIIWFYLLSGEGANSHLRILFIQLGKKKIDIKTMWRSEILLTNMYRAGKKLSTDVSLTTYNILLDGYEHDMEDIDGNTKRVIPWSQRFPHIVNTLLQRNSDIVCIQEINANMSRKLKAQLPKTYTILLGKTGRSGGTRMQCAIMYNNEKYVAEEFEISYEEKKLKTKLFEPQNIHDDIEGWRIVVCKLRNIESGKTICIASVHLAAGEEKNTEKFRETQIDNLLLFTEQIKADCHIICGDFNSDPQLELYDKKKSYKLTQVSNYLNKRKYMNISGNLKTYHGWVQATFDFVYAKGRAIVPESSYVNPNIKQNIPSIKLKEGSDHAALTVNFKLNAFKTRGCDSIINSLKEKIEKMNT